MDIPALLTEYSYVLVFLLMLVGGESVLFPAVYLAISGKLDYLPLIIAAGLATIISDSAWYAIGRSWSFERLKGTRYLAKHMVMVERIEQLVQKHGLKILFFSKFVYGTRIALQLLSGMRRVSFWKYILVNTAGVLSYLMCTLVIALMVDKSAVELGSTMKHIEIISFFVLIIVLVLVHVWLHRVVKHRWFR